MPTQHPSPGLTMETESDVPVQAQTPWPSHHVLTPLPASQYPGLGADKSIFAMPSPPPPGSLYWKYVMHEEDAKWYDWGHKDPSYDRVRRLKKELEEL